MTKEELMYHPQDLAYIIYWVGFGIQEEAQLLSLIFNEEKKFLPEKYKQDQRSFQLQVRYWIGYLQDAEYTEQEISAINQEFVQLGRQKDLEDGSYFRNFESFFKFIRLRLRFFEKRGYIVVKLKTILSLYGYRRRTEIMNEHMIQCMEFYHLTMTVKGRQCIGMQEIKLNDFITVRLEK